MEGSPLLFSDLKAGRSGQCVEARLLRFWEACNVKKGGELMGVDMLLLDSKSTTIQGSINTNRLNTFKGLLHEGSMFLIGCVDVIRSNLCCQQGRVKLPMVREPPGLLKKLLETPTFGANIRIFNASLAFTSIGARVEHTVNGTQGPFSYRI